VIAMSDAHCDQQAAYQQGGKADEPDHQIRNFKIAVVDHGAPPSTFCNLYETSIGRL
jgi:hypothetical protein